MPASASSIWLPETGVTDLAAIRVDRAVKEYDENLRFGRNEETGQWCVFLLRRGFAPLPVLGFRDIPHPEDAVKRLYQADAQRRGEEILDEVNRHNREQERLENAATEQQIGQAVEDAAEHAERLARLAGSTRYGKSFRPRPDRMGGWI